MLLVTCRRGVLKICRGKGASEFVAILVSKFAEEELKAYFFWEVVKLLADVGDFIIMDVRFDFGRDWRDDFTVGEARRIRGGFIAVIGRATLGLVLVFVVVFFAFTVGHGRCRD